jgi:hypothetical protein
MPGRETEVPEDRVRDALVQLRSDSASAPEVPAPVMDRVYAALRSAPPPAHAATPPIPWSRRWRLIALVVGIGGASVAVAVALAVLLHSSPSPRFPSGPTAEKITVSRTPVSVAPSTVTRP